MKTNIAGAKSMKMLQIENVGMNIARTEIKKIIQCISNINDLFQINIVNTYQKIYQCKIAKCVCKGETYGEIKLDKAMLDKKVITEGRQCYNLY